MLEITSSLSIPMEEIELKAIHSHGPGGQNVNKVATAVQLFFDIPASSLPEDVKTRLLAKPDQRVTEAGVVVIKARQRRTQEKNREDALERLRDLIRGAAFPPRKRKPTRPTRGSRERRLKHKAKHSRTKTLRRKVDDQQS